MAWTALTFAYGSLLTSTKMTQMQDNFTALAQGLSGAPVILQAAIDNAAVGQGELKTTDGNVAPPAAPGGHAVLPAGQYGFYLRIADELSDANTVTVQTCNTFNAPADSGATTTIYFGYSAGSFRAYQRYVSASPPYDLGDGEIPLFVFAIVNSAGAVEATYIAQDAPWHNNGPTSIRPNVEINGRKYQRRRQILAEFGSAKAALQAGLTRAQIMDRFAMDPMVDREVTQTVKQADMGRIPHPWCFGNNLTGKTVVLLDPVSPLVERLGCIHDSGEDVNDIINGWVTIGNTALTRSGPPGVMVVNATLK